MNKSTHLATLSVDKLLQLENEVKANLRAHQATLGKTPHSVFLSELERLNVLLENIQNELTSRSIAEIHNRVLVMYFNAIRKCVDVYAESAFLELLKDIENLGGKIKHVEYSDGLTHFSNTPTKKCLRPQVADNLGRELRFYKPLD
jgi:hypothetical protein